MLRGRDAASPDCFSACGGRSGGSSVLVLHHYGASQPGALISDSIQFLLGIGATWAAFAASRRSAPYARKVWGLVAVSLAIYTAGQGIVIYYDNVIQAPLFTPWISDQFLFFWIVP